MIALVLGGARSGKSTLVERWAARGGEAVTYFATLQVGDDPNLAERVAVHRGRRPAVWRTVEAGRDLPALLGAASGTAVVDSLGPWVAGHGEDRVDVTPLCAALTSRSGDTFVVSEEVGLGVHPSSEAGRAFRDVLGTVNQAVAAVADEVYLVVAGRLLPLEKAD